MLEALKTFVENAYVNLIAGLVLLLSATVEIFRSLESAELGAHHGVALFALLQILKGLPHLVHGAESVSKFGK